MINHKKEVIVAPNFGYTTYGVYSEEAIAMYMNAYRTRRRIVNSDVSNTDSVQYTCINCNVSYPIHMYIIHTCIQCTYVG